MRLVGMMLLIVLATGCSEDEMVKLESGVYSGSFTAMYDVDKSPLIHDVSITIDGNRFTCSSGPQYIPAGGSGTFQVEGNEITFVDENVWTANFDWGLILNGTYLIRENNGEYLIQCVINDVVRYEYQVKKE
ncbi:hypothetical protein [Marinoscillum sp.]|uniref:hypothetical protein n=1 Tax=Marinoscillum sp. TaxID=2024838 RepID=UPI003BA8C71F